MILKYFVTNILYKKFEERKVLLFEKENTQKQTVVCSRNTMVLTSQVSLVNLN